MGKIQKLLSRKELLIEFFFSDEYIYAFLINKNTSKIIEIKIDDTFQFHLNNILNSLSNNNFSNHSLKDFKMYQESSFYLYEKLFGKVKDEIKNKDLIIIPDGKLAYLPFEVLTTKKIQFNRINYKNLPYFLYQHNLIVLFENC